MSVQKFHGTINTDGIKDERGIETPSLSATGKVAGQTGVFTESVTAPGFSGDLTGNVTGDLTGTAAKATADAEGNVIPTTYATKEELAEETSARETAESNLSKGITDEANARAAAIEDIVDGTTTVGKATADGNGNNIASTYATQSALSSGLAGKANTSGTYSGLTVGNATNADIADGIPNGNGFVSAFKEYENISFALTQHTINPSSPTATDTLFVTDIATDRTNMNLKFLGCFYKAANASGGRLTHSSAVSVFFAPSGSSDTNMLTIFTGNGKGFQWNGKASEPFTTFGGATLPSELTIYALVMLEA